MDKKTETNELSNKEIREIIEMIDDESYSDDYETTWDGRVTYIRVNEDSDGCSAYYGYDEYGPRHSIEPAYEIHKLMVGDYVIGFNNYGDGDITGLKIFKNSECSLPNGKLNDTITTVIQSLSNSNDGDYVIKFSKFNCDNISGLQIKCACEKTIPNGNMQDELISAIQTIVEDEVNLPDDVFEQFNKDWTDDEVVEEIESQLESEEYIEVDGTIYPADDWEYVVESLFNGDEPDEDSYTKMDRHEVAQELAYGIDLGGY